jgi:hypothetical protein
LQAVKPPLLQQAGLDVQNQWRFDREIVKQYGRERSAKRTTPTLIDSDFFSH